MCCAKHENWLYCMNQLPLYIIHQEPLTNHTPAETLQWLTSVSSEKTIAAAYATVSNHVGYLMHELDEDDCWIEEAFDAWREVEEVIYQRIVNLLKAENDSGIANHTLSGIGTHYIVKPFMLRHGYRDGGGWWIEDAEWKDPFNNDSMMY